MANINVFIGADPDWKPSISGKEHMCRATAELEGDIGLHFSGAIDEGDDAELTFHMSADSALRLAQVLINAARFQGQANLPVPNN